MKKYEWHKIDEKEEKLLKRVLGDHKGFEYKSGCSPGKYSTNDEELVLDINVMLAGGLDDSYNGDVIALSEKAKDVIYDFEQEHYYSIKFTLNDDADYLGFGLRMYREKNSLDNKSNV